MQRSEVTRTSPVHGTAFAVMVCLGLAASPLSAQTQTAPPVPQEVPSGKILVEVARFDGDYQRVEEFTKRFSAQIVRSVPPSLILLVDRDRLPALREAGYQLRFPDADDVFEQLIHVEPASDATIATVRNLGGRLAQREPAYAVFRVNRRQLKLLQQQGLKVRTVRDGELSPRWVEITPADESSVAAAVAAGVDVIDGRDGRIIGRAFDDQIESLTRAGLKVTIVPPPRRPPR